MSAPDLFSDLNNAETSLDDSIMYIEGIKKNLDDEGQKKISKIISKLRKQQGKLTTFIEEKIDPEHKREWNFWG